MDGIEWTIETKSGTRCVNLSLHMIDVSFFLFQYIWSKLVFDLCLTLNLCLNVRWCVCRYRFTLRTAGKTVTEDGRHPQGRWSSVKDDPERLRRSSNGNNAVVCQLQLKIRHYLPHDQHELLFVVSAVSFSESHSHLRVFGQGHATRSVTFIKPGRWVVCISLLVLLPQTLLLQDLPRCLPPRQRDPDICQNEHLLIICWPLQVSHHDWLTSRGTRPP